MGGTGNVVGAGRPAQQAVASLDDLVERRDDPEEREVFRRHGELESAMAAAQR
ncbi:hypothetical protein D3C83_115910 [compost metagenome]